jgi:hypothetical protein
MSEQRLTMTIEEAGRLLGVGRNLAYAAAAYAIWAVTGHR